MKASYITFQRAICDLFEVSPKRWCISRICVPVGLRGVGHGSYLLRQVLRDADVLGITLELNINPYGTMTFGQLRSWYERYGFVSEDNTTWTRQPRRCAHELTLRTPHLWTKWECIGVADNLEYRNCPICWTTLTLYNFGDGPHYQPCSCDGCSP